MPGHIRHQAGDTFAQVYLGYHGTIPASAFAKDFGPDEKFLYQRRQEEVPRRWMERVYDRHRGASALVVEGGTFRLR